jgi:hypothetical protein
MDNYWGMIMKNKIKLFVLGGLFAFPLMVAFQNCSKTVAMQMTDEAALKAGAPVIDTNNLPSNENIPIDQQAPSSDDPQVKYQPADDSQVSSSSVEDSSSDSSSSSSDSSSSSNSAMDSSGSDDGVQAASNDVSDARRDCEADLKESANDGGSGKLSEDGKSLTDVHGKKVISSSDFNGLTDVDLISANGNITICGLHVKVLRGSASEGGGKLILIDSTVDDLSGHNANIIVDGSRAIISNSSGSVIKTSDPSDEPASEKSHGKK